MSLSISDFQKISNGTYNAGDITLTSSGKLDKVNNHVGLLKGWNNKSVDAATTLAVKNAFVQALQNAGVDAALLDDVRKDLGLPQSGSTKGFDLTTLKPLTRAQTRQILDRFSGVINQNAGRTVVSNKWDALKAADFVNYKNHMDLASQINRQTIEDRAAAQKALGREIRDYGIDSIPRSVRKSAVFAGLSADEKDLFAKKFSVMLLKGGADVSSIAAEAMKKVLISKYGGDIADKDKQALFRGMADNISATTDLSRIDAEIRAAKDAATGAKLELDFDSEEMTAMTTALTTTGKLRILYGEAESKSADPEIVADNFAKGLMGEEFLKDAVSCFREQAKNIGELELDGKPSYELKKLENGQTELRLSFDARIGGEKKTAGARCEMLFRIDPDTKSYGCWSRMELKPARKLAEFHKAQIIENIKNTAISKEAELPEDEVRLMEEQISKWDDMGPGQMKNFETWLKDDVASYVNGCIEGKDPRGENTALKFDENGICDVFIKDSNRGYFNVGGKNYIPQGMKNPGLEDAICTALPDKTDRKLITALMNQSSVATMMYLCMNAPDPAKENEKDAPPLRSLDQAGEHVANYTADDRITINQPLDESDLRFELQVDKEKKTATITITADYSARLNQDLFDVALADEKIGRGMEVGKVSYTYQFTVTGLGSGNPQIASADFGQTITARDM